MNMVISMIAAISIAAAQGHAGKDTVVVIDGPSRTVSVWTGCMASYSLISGSPGPSFMYGDCLDVQSYSSSPQRGAKAGIGALYLTAGSRNYGRQNCFMVRSDSSGSFVTYVIACNNSINDL